MDGKEANLQRKHKNFNSLVPEEIGES